MDLIGLCIAAIAFGLFILIILEIMQGKEK